MQSPELCECFFHSHSRKANVLVSILCVKRHSLASVLCSLALSDRGSFLNYEADDSRSILRSFARCSYRKQLLKASRFSDHTARGVLMISPEAVSSFRTGGFWSSPSDSPSRASHSGRTQACPSSREDAAIIMYNVCPALPSEEPPRPPLDERKIQHSDQDRLVYQLRNALR